MSPPETVHCSSRVMVNNVLLSNCLNTSAHVDRHYDHPNSKDTCLKRNDQPWPTDLIRTTSSTYIMTSWKTFSFCKHVGTTETSGIKRLFIATRSNEFVSVEAEVACYPDDNEVDELQQRHENLFNVKPCHLLHIPLTTSTQCLWWASHVYHHPHLLSLQIQWLMTQSPMVHQIPPHYLRRQLLPTARFLW